MYQMNCNTCTYVYKFVAGVLVQTSAPRCLAYLDNGVVFVGSCYGDSQLVEVRLLETLLSFL